MTAETTHDTPPESTIEYRHGREARLKGVSDDDNPHPIRRGFNNARFRWFVGWPDARTAERLEVPPCSAD